MTYEQKQEAIKALVYGGTQEAAATIASAGPWPFIGCKGGIA